MNEEILNAEDITAVVQPEETGADAPEANSGAEETGAEDAAPRDIEGMSDDDFAEYLKQVQERGLSDTENSHEAESEEEEPETGENTDPEEDSAKEDKPYKVYATHEEYQRDFDRVIGERLKKNRESINMLEKLKVQARNFYGDAADDDAALTALLGDLTNQNAEKRGLEEGEYERQTRDAEDARRYREEMQQRSAQQEKLNAIKQKWERDSEEIRQAVPDFDFFKAMENETFKAAILSGKSVQTAYLMASRQQSAHQPRTKRMPVGQVAMQAGVSGSGNINPASLSDDDFNAYIRKIMNE